jgi:hypothetical protein
MTMETCRICHFETLPDDTAVPSEAGQPVCLRCYSRLTGTHVGMPRKLREQIEACLAGVVA